MSFPDLAHHLPYLRRYARALTGSQVRADGYVRATLEAILARSARLDPDLDPKVALYRAFHMIWSGAHPAYGRDRVNGFLNRNQLVQRIGALGPIRREALLLSTLEGFNTIEAGTILDLDADEISLIVENAVVDLVSQSPASVLIVEDEPIISLDLAHIIEGMGHSVAAVAVTRREAIAAVRDTCPDLVLADLQLADGTSGVDAVNDILSQKRVPVVYITAYSERLPAGAQSEPLFLVTKPFAAHSVRAAVGQALLLAEDRIMHPRVAG